MFSALKKTPQTPFGGTPKGSKAKPALKSHQQVMRESNQMRKNLTEEQIDKTLKDSFPASDPPSSY